MLLQLQIAAGLPEEAFRQEAGDLAAPGAGGPERGERGFSHHAPGPHQDAAAGWIGHLHPPGCRPHRPGAGSLRPLCRTGESSRGEGRPPPTSMIASRLK